jgi:cytochrome c biogenesis protein CcmG/thiol:disulfide interchange protein DsbE
VKSAPQRRGWAIARWSAGTVLVVVAVLVAVLATRQPVGEQVVETPLVGHRAPALAGPRLVAPGAGGSGSHVLRLSAFRHRWVLVNFFASWCTVCQSEDPQLERFLYSRPDGVRPVVLGVLYGDTVADGIAFQRAEGATWPAVSDPGGTIASAWGVGSLPRSYLVAPDGRIVACVLGGITAGQLDQLLVRKAAAMGGGRASSGAAA